jgi:arylsulfatase A-like enzyme
MPGKEKFKTVSWGVEEAATMEAIKARFAEHAKRQERFLMTYFPVAPHMPFDTPSERFDKFPSGYETVTRNYSGRYKNQLLYIDWILASLLEGLSDLHLLDNTLVVITNDHGEMVDEPGGKLGHGWSLQPRLCNTPLIIMNPRQKGYRVNYTLGSQVDVLPTLMDILGINLPPGELYEGTSLYDERSNEGRTVYLTSHQQRALIRNSRYIVEDPSQRQLNNCNPTSVFAISHQGTRTVFTPLTESANIAAEMDDFERFQNSFIVHYTHYKALHARGPVAARPKSSGDHAQHQPVARTE